MKRLTTTLLLVAALSVSMHVNAETSTTVTIDAKTKRTLMKDGVPSTDLDREIFFKYHEVNQAESTFRGAPVAEMMSTYDMYFGRKIGGPLGSAYSSASSAYNTYPEGYETIETTTPFPTRSIVISDHTGYGYINGDTDVKEAAKWAAKYFADVYKNLDLDERTYLPEFFEPLNEPFIEASSIDGESEDSPGGITENKLDQTGMIEQMTNYYKECAIAIKSTPALSNMKVIGYGGAYPSYEINDFSHWGWKMQQFIDNAGQYIDGYSFHLYDNGPSLDTNGNLTKGPTLRSGSNAAALLDLIEAYSKAKLGVVKPFAITEFGGSIGVTTNKYDDDPDNDSDYNPLYSDSSVVSMNHLVHNFIDRQDNFALSVMFTTTIAEWYLSSHGCSYGSVLFTSDNPSDYKNSTWSYTGKVKLFQYWRGVQGTRIDIKSSNPDVQTLAFADGNKIYISVDNLNNLELDGYTGETQSVSLSHNIDNIYSITRRQFYWTQDEGVVLNETSEGSTFKDEYTLIPNEGNIFVVTLASTPLYSNEIRRTKYYDIEGKTVTPASGTLEYSYAGVDIDKGVGHASLRMSMGKTSVSQKSDVLNMLPTSISVNGHNVDVPDDWAGDDQVNRGTFLGMINVPVNNSYIVAGENKVEVKFPSQTGTFVASMILEVEAYVNVPETTIVTDGEFESGDLTAWIPRGILGRASLSSGSGVSGSALKLEGDAGVMQTITVEAGKSYGLSFQSKSSDGATVEVKVSDSTDVTLKRSNTSTTYSTLTGTFTPKSNSAQIEIRVRSGSALIDEVSLIKSTN